MSKARYSEIFSSPDRKSERTFLVADLVGSKDLARSGVSYDDFLKNAVQFFDICDDHLGNHGAERIRLDGDAVKAAFDPDQAHMAVKAAIAIHKASKGLPHPTLAAVGIATGSVVDVDDDYASMVTISARHLALAGSPLSILICLNTAQRIGAGSHFAADAIGDRQAVLLPIASKPVEYHEVKWDKIRYGLKSKAVTQGLSLLSR
ncbi:hypothetical protein WKR88_08490 [Trinickia caryophylli]|uniref:Adenylate cyclase, class 3 n=1 Tax=Trinickia caryophylli TaxID=28094 RepID=A0A1X7EE67_TRICW|nr:hypothetical protein [Trinickia caryophylli]PMS11144.1 hypothetical protein C0Z17_16850 [Trinickia caryophylli]TRX14603.1 hypothetical protein FNF07_25475 [Trinickia caryophylli]WQE14445.1 hypothetical protein U0034_27665 [Trinickia caryophylli]SMF32392.1 hypothetical protein SAMN06295900_105268 [Trinickia caryophylli]GLU32152.1 hypothetical protein Busp01_19940 [Trinickia caryophylli]